MRFYLSRTLPLTALAFVLWLVVLTAGCTRTVEPSAGTNVNAQAPSPFSAQPTPDGSQANSEAEAIVPVAPAGEVIDTAQLPDTLYGNTTDMSAPQFYDATAPASPTAQGATVIAAQASLHIRPDAKSKTVGQVAGGEKLRLNNRSPSSRAWFYVATANGINGWIHGNHIKLVANATAKTIDDGADKSVGEKGKDKKPNDGESDAPDAPRSKNQNSATPKANTSGSAADANDKSRDSATTPTTQKPAPSPTRPVIQTKPSPQF